MLQRLRSEPIPRVIVTKEYTMRRLSAGGSGPWSPNSLMSSATSPGPDGDYLGEVGLGRTDCSSDAAAGCRGDPEFPWLLAWCGDIDITGYRRPASYYR